MDDLGEAGEVGEAARRPERAQPTDAGGQVLVLAAEGVVEDGGELDEPVEERKPGMVDLSVQLWARLVAPSVPASLIEEVIWARKLLERLSVAVEERVAASCRESAARTPSATGSARHPDWR
ncbi:MULTISPECIES: hypothetical protein [unclassified Streptomyces]|uniref:hypothetical protein n=1 Tax=unclassified Streptomyces TaxID=2593676 RepID=UPI00333314CB